jgi:hypothetical protein
MPNERGAAGPAVAVDLDGDGTCDVLQAFSQGTVLCAGRRDGAFDAKWTPLRTTDLPDHIGVADFDGDGLLDVWVSGAKGAALLRQSAPLRFDQVLAETGELEYHGPEGDAVIAGSALADVNADGRMGLALFYRERAPAVFFNRGFGCFGLARELVLSESEDPVRATLAKGQVAGAAADLNGDGILDLLGVGRDGQVAVLLGKTDQRPHLTLTLSLPDHSNAPITATVATDRPLGAVYLAPGRPATIACASEGPVQVTWRSAAGRAQSRAFEVLEPTRCPLSDGTPGSRAAPRRPQGNTDRPKGVRPSWPERPD